MKQLRSARDPDDLEGTSDVATLWIWGRRFRRVVNAAVVAIVGGAVLWGYPVAALAQNLTSELLIKPAVFVYYACWYFGTAFDLKVQQEVYVRDPLKGRVSTDILIFGAIFLVFAVLLVLATNDEKEFGVLLAPFIIMNIVGWHLLVLRVKAPIRASRKRHRDRQEFFRLEKLNLVSEYVVGSWQARRFKALLAIIVAVNAIAWIDPLRQLVAFGASTIVTYSLTDLPVDVAARLLPGICVIIFVTISEAWIWTKRVGLKASLQNMDDLRNRYHIKESRSRATGR